MPQRFSHCPRYIFIICWTLTLLMIAFSRCFAVEIAHRENEWAAHAVMDIHVNINMNSGIVSGRITTFLPKERTTGINVSGLELKQIKLEHKVIRPVIQDGIILFTPQGQNRLLEIQFQKDFTRNNDVASGTTLPGNFISPQGAMLLDGWCPTFTGLGCYHLSATVPSDMQAVSEADRITFKADRGRRTYFFDFPYPREEISLVVGKYITKSIHTDAVEIVTYFFPEDQKLAETYLKKAKGYLELYTNLLGPYPFKRFSIVENIAPTGYGLPSYTLLGRQVIHLPFIVDTSLGHEILHNWFGNSVYVDYSKGNWAEGLTTYLADQLYEQRQGKGSDYRHWSLVEYQSYVHHENKLALKDFRYRKDRSTKAIGYIKGAMVFHMLEELVSKPVFERALKDFVNRYRFKAASWNDIQMVFETHARTKLTWFFDQWLNRTDCPELFFKQDPTASSLRDNKYLVTISIGQKARKPYSLLIPITIHTTGSVLKRTVFLDSLDKEVCFEIDGLPKTLVIDPNYDLMRVLTPSEFPPVLARLLGAKNKFYVMDKGQKDTYRPIIPWIKRWGLEALPAKKGPYPTLSKGSVLVLGEPWQGWKGPGIKATKGVEVRVENNRFSRGDVIVYLLASSAEELSTVGPKLSHYGTYCSLSFVEGRVKEKVRPEYTSGIEARISPDVMGLPARELRSITKIIETISNNKVVFVGERHDQYSHHIAQLKVIKGLNDMGINLAVGMEMFQKSSQKYIDDYLAGKIDETTFLKQTQYFKRWGYDYHLYRPIISYCKDNNIPIVALNIPSEISKKVARRGIASLTDEEKKKIPKEIDLKNQDYRAWLKDVFEQHSRDQISDFEYFFQAQVLWDEGMAKSAVDYLKKHPKKSMVILAGDGHLAFGYGIPSRVKRRGGYSCAILINTTGGELQPDMADYFLFPGRRPAPFSAKLGVIVMDRDNKVVIKGVSSGSPASRAGLKKNDIILELDGKPIKSVSDLKIALVFVKQDEKVRLRIKRIRRFAPDKLMDIQVGPFEQGTAMQFLHRQ